ncbi:hypothetical protein BDF19DRAFT_447925 [Syncephalis fuscata]|nr:hypothetical protein BDF19DRAFT_447925 [Syncephalis fuscata]
MFSRFTTSSLAVKLSLLFVGLVLLVLTSVPATEAGIEPFLLNFPDVKCQLPPPKYSASGYTGNTNSTRCLYAEGLGANYSVVADECAKNYWRPGQTWKFDGNFTQGYQPIRIGEDLCLGIEAMVSHSPVKVNRCPADSSRVDSKQMWRLGCNDYKRCWLRNLATDYCLSGNDDSTQFYIIPCHQSPTYGPQLFSKLKIGFRIP